MHIALTVKHFNVQAFCIKCGLQRDLMSCSSRLTLLNDAFFSCTFPFFEKATNLFNTTGHLACSPNSTKISIDILLPAANTFGLKLAQPTSQNDFKLYLLLVGVAVTSVGAMVPAPHLSPVPPHFMFGPPTYHEAVELLCAVVDSQ